MLGLSLGRGEGGRFPNKVTLFIARLAEPSSAANIHHLLQNSVNDEVSEVDKRIETMELTEIQDLHGISPAKPSQYPTLQSCTKCTYCTNISASVS